MNLHQLSPRHRSESAFALSKRRVQALRDLPCNLWYTMSSRKQAEGFQRKRGFVFCREFRTKHSGTFFFEARKGWFQKFGPIDIIYNIYNRFEMENCRLTGQVLSSTKRDTKLFLIREKAFQKLVSKVGWVRGMHPPTKRPRSWEPLILVVNQWHN